MPLIKARSSSIINSVDLRGTPTAVTAPAHTSTTQLATTAFVSSGITDLINSAPALLDTLSELAAAIANDENFATTIATSIATKVNRSGDTMTGSLYLFQDPTSPSEAVNKNYVDSQINAQMIYDTDGLTEGSLNLYYTAARVHNAISLASDNTNVLSYNSATGGFTYTHPSSDGILEGQTNLYFTAGRVRNSISLNSDDNQILGYSSTTGEFTFTTPDTDKIVEGTTNKYFLTSRARDSISNGSNIDYDSATGIISTQAAVWSVNGQTHDVVLDTDDINEGSTNLYFTNARVGAAISLTTDNSNILSYSSGTGTFTFVTPSTDAISEGTSNLYYTDARVRAAVSASGDISYNGTTGNFSYSTPTTDGVAEGATNLYFTNARAAAAISLTTDNSDALSYNTATGTFTFSVSSINSDEITEGATNLYFTTARARDSISTSGWGNLSYNSATGVIAISAPSTDDVTEGSNLYFTTTRARDSVSAVDAGGDGSFSYDSATGAFTYTGPSASEVRAHFSADTATGAQYDNTTGTFSLASIPNASLTNSSVTVNGATVSLGGSTSFGTDSVTEETNLYFTNARSRSAISLTSNKTSVLDYNSTTGVFTFDLGNQTTDDIAEGTTNLYFTTQRARDSVSAVDAGGDGSFSYDSATGAFTYTGPSDSEVRAHFSATTASGVTYDSATGVFALSAIPNSSLANSSITIQGYNTALGMSLTFDTSDVAEGTNLYYTQARFDTALAGKTTSDVAEGTNLYYTQARFDSAFAAKSTADLAEDPSATATSGTQYFTQSRARNTLSGGTGVTYTAATGEIAIGQDVSTTSNVTFNDLVVNGDLTVNGTMTAVNSTTVTIADLNITLAQGSSNAAQANGAGITVDGSGAAITYQVGIDGWSFNKPVSVTGTITATDEIDAPLFRGPLVGDVTGNVTGDLYGNATSATRLQTARNIQGVSFDGTGNITVVTAGTGVTVSGTEVSIGQAVGTGDSVSFAGVTSTFTGNLTGNVLGNVTGTVSSLSNHSTDDLSEGVTNQYFLTSRARDSVSATTASGVTYNSATGVFALSAIPNSSLANSSVTVNGATVSLGGSTSFGTDSVTEETNLYFTNARARSAISLTTSDSSTLSYNSTTGEFVFDLAGISTDEVTEGVTNLYFTTQRARDSVSIVDAGGDGSFAYDSATGVFTYTGPNDSEVRAHFSADTATGAQYDTATGTFSLASIPNSSLVNTTVEINGTTVTLGGSNSFGTDSVTEGTTNKYYLDSRARNAISLTSDNLDALSYDAATGTFAFSLATVVTDEITEGATNLYFTTARARDSISTSGWANLSYDNVTGIISISAPSTSDVTEGTNLYFTEARARSAISLTTDNTDALSYDSVTGTFSFTLNSVDTDEIAEGATNKYFTTARARDSVNNGSNIDYDSATGTISTQAAVWSVNGQTHDVVLDTDNINEGSTNLYYTDARAAMAISLTTDNSSILSYAQGTGTFTFVTPTTDAISEGAVNLYYTDARADARIGNASVFDLSDVALGGSTLTDGYTLVWSSATQNFVPQNVAVTATTLNFTGDGTTLSFNTGVEVTSIDNTQVYINGLIQAPTYSYTMSTVNGETSIEFDTAPEANDYIYVRVSATSTLTAGGVLNEASNIDGGTY